MCCFHIYYRYYKNVTTGIVLQRKEVVNFFTFSFFAASFSAAKKPVLSASFQNKDTDKTFIYLIIYAKTLRSAYTKEM